MKVLAVVNDKQRCLLARLKSGQVYISYPRGLMPRAEAKYIALRFGHLVPDGNVRVSGISLAKKVLKEMQYLISEDEISLELLAKY